MQLLVNIMKMSLSQGHAVIGHKPVDCLGACYMSSFDLITQKMVRDIKFYGTYEHPEIRIYWNNVLF